MELNFRDIFRMFYEIFRKYSEKWFFRKGMCAPLIAMIEIRRVGYFNKISQNDAILNQPL